MGRGIQADGAPGAAVDGFEHRANGAFAVRARDVDDRVGALRVAEAGGEQREAVDAIFGADLLLEAVKVGLGGGIIHESKAELRIKK